MRIVLALIASAFVFVSSASSQQSGFSATPFVGYQWVSPIYQHDFKVSNELSSTESWQRLSVEAAPAVGARIDYGTASKWMFYVEGSYRAPKFRFVDSTATAGPAGPGGSWERHVRDAKMTSLSFGFGRRFQIGDAMPSLGLNIGGAWQRFNLDKTEMWCAPPSGGWAWCTPEEPWAPKYDVPSLMGALTLYHDLTTRVGIQARAGYAIGRTNTEGFTSEFDQFGTPSTYWVRTTTASLGISIRP